MSDIMKSRKNILFLILGLSISINPLRGIAQTGETSEVQSGSIYSTFGVGFPVDVTNSAYLSQGILGLTGINKQSSNIANPAIWATTFLTHATTGVNVVQSNISNASGSARNVNFEPGYLHLTMPISPGRIGLSVGLYPYTRANYVLESTGSFPSSNDDIDFNNEVQNIGGINKFEVGFGIKLTENISLGYAPSVAFINQTNSEDIIFSDLGFRDTFQERELSGAAFSQRFGLVLSSGNIFSEDDNLSFGATVNLPFEIGVNESFTSIKNVEGNDEEVDLTTQNNGGDISIPLEFSLGIGYAPSRAVNFSIEGQSQRWGDYKNTLNTSSESLLKDRLKLGIGGEYHPYRTGLETPLSRFKYSAGLSYDTGHLNIEGEDIQTLWINAGLGIPSRVASFIDLSVQYGIRGNSTVGLFEERIWAVGISVSLSELMFVRPKLR